MDFHKSLHYGLFSDAGGSEGQNQVSDHFLCPPPALEEYLHE
jgi:hypothetical protein